MEIKAKGGIITVIEQDRFNIEIKTLLIKLRKSAVLKEFAPPKMKYILFTGKDDLLIITLKYDPLRSFFNSFIKMFVSQISKDDSSNSILEKLNNSIRSLKKLVETEKSISPDQCQGFYGELLYLKSQLMQSKNHKSIIEGWHRPSNSNHDFDYDTHSIEVKTISRLKTHTKISSEYQLESYEGKDLYLVIYRIERSGAGSLDSLGKLYNEILQLITNFDNKQIFINKCVDSHAGYIGPEIIECPYNFQLIDEMHYFVDQEHFPRIKRENLLPSLSNLTYFVDVSAIESFKKN